MAGKRKSHSAGFKAQVALAAVKGDRTINELASHYGVHPTLIHAWEKQFLAGAEAVFASGAKTTGPRRTRRPNCSSRSGDSRSNSTGRKQICRPRLTPGGVD